MRSLWTLIAVLAFQAVGISGTIYVPDDYPTIQDAINAANHDDTVIVRSGTYYENIDFVGKAITVTSEFGTAVTVIDGNDSDCVVSFTNGEGAGSVLSGFTITNGDKPYGGGIYCSSSSPTIECNFFTDNSAVLGGGIACTANSNPDIVNNRFRVNLGRDGAGGIYCYESSPLISGNVLDRNLCHSKVSERWDHRGAGGGINCYVNCSPVITNNLIINNRADFGGGIYLNNSSAVITGNTIAKNFADYCGGVVVWRSTADMKDNILWNDGTTNHPELWVEEATLSISYSDVHGGQAEMFVDSSSTVVWGDGMLETDPLFYDLDIDDFHLRQDPCQPGIVNPCVDAGDPTSALIDGSTRTDGVQDSNVVDMGYHYPYILDGDDIIVPVDYPTIQDAINHSNDGDTIIVQPGTYYENIDFIGRLVTLRSESGPASTVLDGNQSGSVIIIQHRENYFARIEGFTITNGSGTEYSVYHFAGGGIYCNDSSPVIKDNIITGNVLDLQYSSGGGICCHDFGTTIINNVIVDNVASAGGGIRLQSDSSRIEGNLISRNLSNHGGGLLCGGFTRSEIIRNTITGNTASRYGGGIRITSDSSPLIEENIIDDNIVTDYDGWGGGIHCSSDCEPVIKSNIVSENSAPDSGGGIVILYSDPVISNNLIFANTAQSGAGILISERYNSVSILSNNTIVGNTASLEGGGIFCRYDANLTIVNCILSSNDAPEGPEMWIGNSNMPSAVTISYSDVEGGQASVFVDSGCTLNWGDGMIDADPLFFDRDGGDLHLTWDSPCRDTGDNSGVTESNDIEGDPRIAIGTVDMGADEFYYHLYHVGDVVPGQQINLRVVGPPGSCTKLLLGSGILDPPLSTMYGYFYLEQPLTLFYLGLVPSTGVIDHQTWVPHWWQPGDAHPLQAFVGGPQWPSSRLTNLLVLEVD